MGHHPRSGTRTMTMVRFREDAVSQHGETMLHVWQGGIQNLRGQEVAVYLPPTTPSLWWKCDAELCWEIPDEEIVRLTGVAPRDGLHVFVCEHQLDLD